MVSLVIVQFFGFIEHDFLILVQLLNRFHKNSLGAIPLSADAF